MSQTLWCPSRHHSQVPSPWLKGTSTRSPFFQRVDLRTDLLDHAAELVAEDVRHRQLDAEPRPVARPQVPVGATDAVGLDPHDHAVGRTRRVGHLLHDEWLADSFDDGGAHDGSSLVCSSYTGRRFDGNSLAVGSVRVHRDASVGRGGGPHDGAPAAWLPPMASPRPPPHRAGRPLAPPIGASARTDPRPTVRGDRRLVSSRAAIRYLAGVSLRRGASAAVLRPRRVAAAASSARVRRSSLA